MLLQQNPVSSWPCWAHFFLPNFMPVYLISRRGWKGVWKKKCLGFGPVLPEDTQEASGHGDWTLAQLFTMPLKRITAMDETLLSFHGLVSWPSSSPAFIKMSPLSFLVMCPVLRFFFDISFPVFWVGRYIGDKTKQNKTYSRLSQWRNTLKINIWVIYAVTTFFFF